MKRDALPDLPPGDVPPLTRLRKRLVPWFERHRRPLPWRETADPYAIWISEVMLQQTQVDTVIPYYQRFLSRFPDPARLAAASEDDVLEAWAGLGYYSRGRNLHRAAAEMVREHAGNLPGDIAALKRLPGIGDYTAAAVGSIAFGLPHAVVDGNVERVLCRFLALDGDPRKGSARRAVHDAAAAALDPHEPGRHNESMMELGATVCVPRNPRCDECPVAKDCRAHAAGRMHDYPTPRERPPTEEQHWIAVVARVNGAAVVVRTAPDAELLAGHWGVPLERWPADRKPSSARCVARAQGIARRVFGGPGKRSTSHPVVKHAITYRRLRVHPVSLELDRMPEGPYRKITGDEADGLPALFRKILRSKT